MLEAATEAQMRHGIMTTTDAHRPVGAVDEEIMGGSGRGTVRMLHTTGHTPTTGEMEAEKGGRWET